MPSWPARRVWRPGPLAADAALALVLAAFSLVTVQTGGESRVRSIGGPEIQLSSTPTRPTPGEPWNVEIKVHQGENPLTPFRKIKPRLTIRNTKTGESTSYQARPVKGLLGVYQVRAVFPEKGVYSYKVDVGGFERTVGIGEGAPGAVRVPASDSNSFPLWALGLTLLATLPVALRRRYPVPVLAVTLSGMLAAFLIYGRFQLAGALVALYTVAAHVGRPTSVHAGLATTAALAFSNFNHDPNWRYALLFNAAAYAVFAAAWLLGDNLRTRRAYLSGLEERADRLEREREENVRRAAAEEQARIARELHDIIAHNVSVMTVQAAAAGDAFETQPGRVREALASIESTGREALTELRRLLGSVRPDDGQGSFAPQPGLGGLHALVEQVRTAGLMVELTVEGSPRELPPGVDLSAYRIVQEALTNTLKHGAASKASVLIRYGAAMLDVEIVDDGRGATADGADRGHGIIGMRERASLVGGQLRVGPADPGGFSVRARIPLEDSES